MSFKPKTGRREFLLLVADLLFAFLRVQVNEAIKLGVAVNLHAGASRAPSP